MQKTRFGVAGTLNICYNIYEDYKPYQQRQPTGTNLKVSFPVYKLAIKITLINKQCKGNRWNKCKHKS